MKLSGQRSFSEWTGHLTALVAKGGLMPMLEVGVYFDSDHPHRGWRVYQRIMDETGICLLQTPAQARQQADLYDACQIRDDHVDWLAAELRRRADEAEQKNGAGETP